MVGPKVCFQTLILLGAGAVYGAVPGPFLFTEAPQFSASGERFPNGARLMLVSSGAPRPLVPGLAASAEAAVSFDGKRALFAGKDKAGAPWQVWEIDFAGGTPRRITAGDQDCVRPFYLPDNKLVYSRRSQQGFELEIAPVSGGTPLRVTFDRGDHFATDVLADGRILFDGPQAAAGRDVYTIYTDGSGVETVRCDHGRDRHAGRQLTSGDIIFETGTGLARFTSARATQVEVALPKGQFAGPVAEIAPGEWLVAYRALPTARYTLYRVKPGQSQTPPEKVMAAASGHAFDPVPVRPRTVPNRHPSGLGDRNGANTLCLNAYTTRDAVIPEGVLTAVRVYAQNDEGASIVLGEAPVEADGSFYIQAPSERPIRFELLGKASKIVRTQKGWFSMRRGEQRVCVGCHAGPERAPENAVPAVLLRTTDPVKMIVPVHTGNAGAK